MKSVLLLRYLLFVARTLSVYIILVSPGTSIFKESRYCIPLYCLELLATNIFHLFVVYSSTSAQSTFVKPKVNVLKDTQILTKTTYVQKEGYSSTSAQSTFLKPKVNVLKDIQILTKTCCIQKSNWKCVNSFLVIDYSLWILLGKYHHISIQLLSSVNPPVSLYCHQSFSKFKISYGVI